MPALRNQREEAFCHEVAAWTAIDRAYLLAGYESQPQFARANACKLLRKPTVAARVDELRAEFRKHCALNLEFLQETLRPIVTADMAEYVTGGKDDAASGKQRFKEFSELQRGQGLAVSSIKLGEDGEIVELKLHNKIEAAKALMVSLGMRDAEHGNNDAARSLGDRLKTAIARAGANALPAPDGRQAAPIIDGQLVDGDVVVF